MAGFVHLHVHSDYSLQDGAVSVMALADKAEKLGMSHLALTDHGCMFGAMDFLKACEETIDDKGWHVKRAKPIKPIIGCEVYVSPGSRFEKKGSENENRYYHLVLLASNLEGYQNLVKLCSFGYTEGFYYKPRIDEELLAQYHGGIIALSACASGEIPALIQGGKLDEAAQRACHYRDLFGKDEKGNANFFLELQDHGIPAEELRGPLSQDGINQALIQISKSTGIPLVATNDVHYLDREDYVAHDILLCIGTGKVRTDEKRIKYHGDQFYLKSEEEMAALFPQVPEALLNSQRIADRCVMEISRVDGEDLHKYLPEFDIPEGFTSSDEYLRHLTYEGLAKRYAKEKQENGKPWEEILNRADHELDLIIRMGFAGYFLIVEDFVRWAQDHDIPVGFGRGSGVGSIVAYSLHITGVDPLKYKLLFERFLNLERISMPDFDVDFTNQGRDDVIRYVTEKYGRDRVGQIITFGTLGAKVVIKDVARVLNISIPESEMITKLIPGTPGILLQKAIDAEPRLQELEQDPKYTELFSLAKKLEGLNRHSSVHASGVVIGRSKLHDFVPLYRDPKTSLIATQYDMNFLEACGLVKMDFLGLKTLDVIKATETLIRERGGSYADFSLDDISEEDQGAFAMLSEGRSFGVFQFESDGMQSVLRRARPNCMEDLIALVALYRPGPMDNIGQFIDSKSGRQPISYPDPSLEDTLKDTYGVIVYQEQVMQVARIIAGYSLGQADILRRAMGKKIKEILDKEKVPFLEGAAKQGYSQAKAEEIFDILVPFAGYGFNKSHAAGYAMVAYRTAYLKANFPLEFMAANLTNEIHSADKDKLSVCIAEARKMGLSIDPPDINRSQKIFTVVDGRIVYGFLGIKGIGDLPIDEIIARRGAEEGGDYRDFMDFLNRVEIKTVGKAVIERLVRTGAFDKLGISRETLLGNLERAVEYVQKIKDDKKFGQVSLFGEGGSSEQTDQGYIDFEFETFPEIGRTEKLNIEKELIGFYFSGHPMDEYKELWEKLVKADLSSIDTTGSHILIGLIKSIKVITTSRGDKMAFAALEDFKGEIELCFFKDPWEKCQSRIEADKVAILKGRIEYQSERDKYSFVAEEMVDPREAVDLLKQEEIQARKWDKYRNVWKFAKDLEHRFPDLGRADLLQEGSYTIIGALKSLRTHVDRKGKEMAFGTIQDNRGEIDAVFFSRAWEHCKDLCTIDEVLALKGTIEAQKDKSPPKMSFVVSSIQDLNKLIRGAAKKAAEEEAAPAEAEALKQNEGPGPGAEEASYREVHIRLAPQAAQDQTLLYTLRNSLDTYPGSCPVFIHIPVSVMGKDGSTVVRIANHINGGPGPSIEALAQCSGVADIWGVP
ncbi:MAG: DNA polymerase III subunit alpha [Treponema sp.]|nr:DNA polymerase III subunit alpha [Treponema sp.]